MGHSVEMTYFLHLFVFSFHMPIFFIISGFLFAHSNSITLSFGEIAYKRFRSLLLPYVTTGLIIILLKIIILFYGTWTTAYNATDNLIFSITHSMNVFISVYIKSRSAIFTKFMLWHGPRHAPIGVSYLYIRYSMVSCHHCSLRLLFFIFS